MMVGQALTLSFPSQAPQLRAVEAHETRLERFQHGVEQSAGLITKAAGTIGGAWVGCEAVHYAYTGAGMVAAHLGAALSTGPIAMAAMGVAFAAATVGGALFGLKLSRKVNDQVGRLGQKMAGRVKLTDKAATATAKSALAVGRSALLLVLGGVALGCPWLLPAIGLASVGSTMLGTGLFKAARGSAPPAD